MIQENLYMQLLSNKFSMKKELLFFIFLVLCTSLFASNYYVSNSGSDNNSGTNKSEAWATLDKVNASMSSYSPGDSILFKRGDVFVGTLDIRTSGNSNNPIVFAAYDSGTKPVIKASKQISGWTQNGNIWTADCPDCPETITNLFIDDNFQPLGRYPNNSYLTISSAEGRTVIIDNDLNFPDGYWNNAEAVFKINHYIIDAIAISSHSGTRLTLSENATYGIQEGYGYFFQNHVNTLDYNGEWIFDEQQKKLQVYSSNNLNNQSVEIAFNDYCIDIGSYQYISIENLELTHSRVASLNEERSSYINFNHNLISFSGGNAIELLNSTYSSFDNNEILNSNNCSFYSKLSNNLTFSNNTVKRNALIPGRGYSGNAQYTGMRIQEARDVLVEYNHFDSIGFNGIMFWYTNNTVIKNNFINYSCLIKSDGGGIYTWANRGTGNKIIGNIILNTTGSIDGNKSDFKYAMGIYLDNITEHCTVENNTVAYSGQWGIYNHGNDNKIIGNTSYENVLGQLSFLGIKPDMLIDNCEIRNNYLFATGRPNQWVMHFENVYGENIFENNVLCDPFDLEVIWDRMEGGQVVTFSVTQWQNLGNVSDKPIPLTFAQSGLPDTTGFIIFDYNPSKVTKTRNLSGTYRDLENNLITGSIDIAPYSSIILLKEFRSILGAEAIPSGPLEFCQGTENSEYSTSGTTEANSYDWQISPVSAGTVIGTSLDVTIDWNPLYSGTASISYLASGPNNFNALSPPLQVNILPKPHQPEIPDGPASLYQNAPQTDYTTIEIEDASAYDWKIFPSDAGRLFPNGNTCSVEWNEPYFGNAYVSVRAENSCGLGIFSDSLKVLVQEAELAYGIINIFTPNGDGFNDYWSIPFIRDFPDATIKIFDRSNRLLIEYNGLDSSWNGTVNGELVPMGSYLYVIDLKTGKPPIKGYVTVLR